MKFAHLADCHIGGWREPKMREASNRAFCMVVDRILQEHVDFVLIAGDLFNTAVPGIDSLRMAVEQLQRIKESGIPIYYIAGSHDFSPSGKTMLDILHEAKIAKNVALGEEVDGRLRLKFTQDPKTGVKITGLIGKRGGLDANYYQLLDHDSLVNEPGQKIFLFHTALTELKPKGLEQMEAMAVSLLPKNFDYYAGGHVHIVERADIGEHRNVVYPGPTYPNSFSEVEKLRHGSFVIVENGEVKHVSVEPFPSACITVDAEGKTPAQVTQELVGLVSETNTNNHIVTIRVRGMLEHGKPSDLNWEEVFAAASDAHFVMKNANALKSKELQTVTISEQNVDELETQLIQEHGGQIQLSPDDAALVKQLMHALNAQKLDGEKNADYDKRVHSEIEKLMASNATLSAGRELHP